MTMALSTERLKALAIELAAAMPAPPPRRFELVDGSVVSREAMTVARAFDAAYPTQKAAMLAIVNSWERAS